MSTTHTTRLPRVPRPMLGGLVAIAVCTTAASIAVGEDVYTYVNLGAPPDAYITTAVRMNNLGHVAGYSLYIGQGEPSLRPWVWRPGEGYTILPPPPNMFLGRARAMDISDTGIIAGDGGFDAGIAWRYENGQYETFGSVGGMPTAYLGAVNDAGDVTGTAKDAQLTTEDELFLDVNGVGTQNLTPGPEGARGVDINNAGQICGYSQGPATGFGAFIWDSVNGFEFLGAAGLAYSFATDMNDLGQVVGYAQSASGNTSNSWIYTPGAGQQVLPTRGATAINNSGHVVGTITCCGPDEPWLWTPTGGTRTLFDLFNYVAAGLSGPSCRDINDAGQILLNAYDSNAGAYRPIVISPIPGSPGACCLDGTACLGNVSEASCASQGGVFLGPGTQCVACVPVGACCLTDGDCVPFLSEADCLAQVGTYQGDDTSCGGQSCQPGLPNDDCADAAAITAGDHLFSTLGATTDGPTTATVCGGAFSFYRDIWFTYAPEGPGTLEVTTCNQATFDTQLEAYSGTCADLALVGCNDDDPSCSGFTSTMSVPVECNVPVLIRVGGFSTQSGTGTLTLTFTGDPCTAACIGDTNGDSVVDVDDLVNVILAWGTKGPMGDLTLDHVVDVDDLVELILRWGPCP